MRTSIRSSISHRIANKFNFVIRKMSVHLRFCANIENYPSFLVKMKNTCNTEKIPAVGRLFRQNYNF